MRGGSPAEKKMAFWSGFKQNLRENHDVAHTDRTVSMRGRRLGRIAIGMGRGSHMHAPRRPKELGLAWLVLGFGLVLGLGLG